MGKKMQDLGSQRAKCCLKNRTEMVMEGMNGWVWVVVSGLRRF